MINIAIFASGAGTNAQAIIEHFKNHEQIKIVLIVCNKPQAKVFEVANRFGIKSILIDNKADFNSILLVETLKSQYHVDCIVLAGFLWLIPKILIENFPNKIINIHPALLPKYGGKGMYGHHVHEAVIKNQESKSGITIHYVNQHYDEGDIIFQASVNLDANETPNSLAHKIHQLEHKHFPLVIEKWLSNI